MISLILVACLSAAPASCIEARPYAPGLSLMGCQVLAQQIAADWIEQHPGYEIRRWKCQIGERGRHA